MAENTSDALYAAQGYANRKLAHEALINANPTVDEIHDFYETATGETGPLPDLMYTFWVTNGGSTSTAALEGTARLFVSVSWEAQPIPTEGTARAFMEEAV